MEYCMVITTFPTHKEAMNLAGKLILMKLVACAQIEQIDSIYSWEGEIHRKAEFKLTVKSREALYSAIETFITARHSYDLPQITKIPITGSKVYRYWIDAETIEP
ncbi:MAG: divalent-cation tolerance protein CutA [Desulfobacteraceae bacterium]|nr:MAG: divalent-cation tolerance protein CutA [Desulfobacteraceae bacterium]